MSSVQKLVMPVFLLFSCLSQVLDIHFILFVNTGFQELIFTIAYVRLTARC